MATDDNWDHKLKGFLQKAGTDFKRAGDDIKKEAERLMKEAQDPERQAKVREGVKEATVWARKAAEQLASVVEIGVKQAEDALKSARAPAPPPPTAPSPPPVVSKSAAPPPPRPPVTKTVGRRTASTPESAPKMKRPKKPLGKVPKVPDDGEDP